MNDELLIKLQDVFRRVLNQPNLIINRELTAADVKGWDSLKHVELMVSIESAFGIRFKTAEVGAMNDVGELADLVIAKTAAKR
jgi:acyl carrier protein